MRAMIVDDSRAMRIILRRALASSGYDDITDAEHGRQALEALENEPLPEIAFVDWNMPEMSGIEFVRAVRANSRFDSIALVMVTSETALEFLQEAIDAGADEYVMKPFTPEVLRDKLELVRSRRG
jgi:two-component system chemotaxis response regulator CheY